MEAVGTGRAFMGANAAPRGHMKKTSVKQDTFEPIGIIISRGERSEPVPVVLAYVWGPAPVETATAKVRAA